MSSLFASVRPWQIWLAYVRFFDHPEIGKVRPIVIVDTESNFVISAKITSSMPNSKYRYYELKDWIDEGLLKSVDNLT